MIQWLTPFFLVKWIVIASLNCLIMFSWSSSLLSTRRIRQSVCPSVSWDLFLGSSTIICTQQSSTINFKIRTRTFCLTTSTSPIHHRSITDPSQKMHQVVTWWQWQWCNSWKEKTCHKKNQISAHIFYASFGILIKKKDDVHASYSQTFLHSSNQFAFCRLVVSCSKGSKYV